MSIISTLNNSIGAKYRDPDSKFQVPQQEKIPAEQKNTSEYCGSIAKAAFSALMKNKNMLPADHYSRIQILRDYLYGIQDPSYYINLLKESEPQGTSTGSNGFNTTQSKEAQAKGYEQLNQQVVSSMPAIRNAISGLFSETDQFAFVTTIDQEAGELEDRALAEAYADLELKPVADRMSQMGIPIPHESPFPDDTTYEELEIYKELGGFKSKWAEGAEMLIFFTEKQSDWNDLIKRKFIDDYLATNWVMAREVYDEEGHICKWEYVDIENATIQYSTDRMFGDAEYAGYFTLEKISKLVAKGFDSVELRKAAKVYSGMFGNEKWPNEGFSAPTNTVTDRIWDYRIPVFHYYWIEADVKRTLKVKNEFGEKNFDIPLDKEVKPVSKDRARNGVTQEERNTRVRNVYKCSWVVDTDMVYNFGRLENQARKSKSEPKLPFFAYKETTTNKNQMFGSIVENVIPFLDRQQILWLKYQDALIKAHPGGYMINFRLLQNLEIAGKSINPLEAFEMFWKYGRGVYMDTAMDGRYEGGDVVPIKQIEGNYGQLLAVLSQEMEYIKSQIRDYTGIDPTTVGVASEGSTATEVSMAKQGTNNILRPMIKAIFSVKGQLANYTAKSIQLKIRNVKKCYDVYSDIVGKDVTDLLIKMEKDGSAFGMGLEPKPSDAEVQSLIDAANAAMSTGRDGDSQIDLGQWMYIQERIMNGGNIKKLRRDVAFMIKKKEEKDQQRVLERERVQAQEQAKIAQQSAQIAQETAQMKMQEDMAMQQQKTQDQIKIDNNESNNKIKEMVTELALQEEKEGEDARV